MGEGHYLPVLASYVLLAIKCKDQLATIYSRPMDDHREDSIVLPEADVCPTRLDKQNQTVRPGFELPLAESIT